MTVKTCGHTLVIPSLSRDLFFFAQNKVEKSLYLNQTQGKIEFFVNTVHTYKNSLLFENKYVKIIYE